MAAVSALLMGLGSYLPMVELSRHLPLKLAESATIWPNYLQFNLGDLVTNSLSMYASTSSMQNVSQAFRPGIGVLMLVTGIALAIFWGKLSRAVKVAAGLGFIGIFLSTDLFPWALFSKTVLGTIQFPWRYLELVTLFFSLALGLLVADRPQPQPLALGLVLATCIVGFSYAVNINTTMINANTYRITDKNAVSYYQDSTGGGSEYAPREFDMTTFFKKNHQTVLASHNLERVTAPTQDYNDMQFSYTSRRAVTLRLPKFAYVGYTVTVDGRPIAYHPSGKLDRITLHAPAGTHHVRVVYTGTILQHVTGWLSLAAAFVFLAWWIIMQARWHRDVDEMLD